ncbi:MAG: hypothetical protein GKR91_17395 [Pseudomonadales bacterium]|nr:hypothetical protein [Pseudomonadales bacterium]
MKNTLIVAGFLSLSSIILPQFSLAAEDSRFSLSLGAFVTDYDTETRLDSAQSRGFDTDFEDDLGLDSSDSVFRLDGYYKIGSRHRLDFSGFDLSRSALNQIQQEIQWGDNLYNINTMVDSDFDLRIYKLAYTYSFLEGDNGFLGVTGGLYIADTDITLTDQTLVQNESGDVTAPLPVIGLRGEYGLTERWKLRASAEFFALEIDDKFSGSLSDVFVGLDYQLFENTSLGFGVNSVAFDVATDKNSFDGQLDWNYRGGLVYLKFDF